ncbi:S49 family peptidase [Candidatus Woesearchaeota archaeon]|nr:S49 family peptidase [Candidatus Woesearchaeota archaeon]
MKIVDKLKIKEKDIKKVIMVGFKNRLNKKVILALSIVCALELIFIIFGLIYLSIYYPLVFEKPNPSVLVIDIRGEIISTEFAGIYEERGVKRNISISSENIIQILDHFSKINNFKAFILDIDSNGGDTVGSDELVRYMMKMNKTIIAVIRDSALSGGYLVAAGTDKIYANPMSNIGDIGLVSVNVYRTRNGTKQTCYIPSTKYKNMYLDDCPGFDPIEFKMLKDRINISHNYFVNDLAYLRNVSFEYMAKFGDGAIYRGIEAKEYGLIDEIGDIYDAVSWLEKELNTKLDLVYLRDITKKHE